MMKVIRLPILSRIVVARFFLAVACCFVASPSAMGANFLGFTYFGTNTYPGLAQPGPMAGGYFLLNSETIPVSVYHDSDVDRAIYSIHDTHGALDNNLADNIGPGYLLGGRVDVYVDPILHNLGILLERQGRSGASLVRPLTPDTAVHDSLPLSGLLTTYGMPTSLLGEANPFSHGSRPVLVENLQVSQFSSQTIFENQRSTKEPVVENGVKLKLEFTPHIDIGGVSVPMTLAAAAAVGGYDHFNWFQVVTSDPYPPGGIGVPYVDPPDGGGAAFGGYADSLPFYWDEEGSTASRFHLSNHLLPQNSSDKTALEYQDLPKEPRLQPGESIDFVTVLAAVRPDGSWDGLYAVDWSTNYTGEAGSISVRRNLELDDLSGSGGIGQVREFFDLHSLPASVQQLMVANGARNLLVPEPSTVLLAGFGGYLLLVATYIRRRSACVRTG